MRKKALIVAGFTERESRESWREVAGVRCPEGGRKKRGWGFGDDVRPVGGSAWLYVVLVNELTS